MRALNHSVIKAFDLLDHFTQHHPTWGVRELAQHTGQNKSTIYRLLATLESLGVLRKETQTDRYTLGLKLFELGHRVQLQQSLVHQTHPVLQQVAANISETVHLGVLRSAKVFMVDKVESPMGLKLSSTVGSYSPVHCTSLGKILLAFQPADRRKQLISDLDLSSYTTNTITRKRLLQTQLNEVRTQSYALDREELELGLICVAVPVFNQQRELIAALSAAGPANRFRENALGEYVGILQQGATAIQSRIGSFSLKTIM
ncbi:MAG: IclR family transcriptional regulator [Bacteroidota bacterium]